jgi:cytochrome c biogenesis protein CcmG/thiol:disulfide interchange protein DsbE
MNARLPLIIFAALVLLLAIGLTLNPKTVPSPLVGKPAPNFDLPDLMNHETMHNPADWQGKVWMLTVWASWCGTCVQEQAVLNQLKHDMPQLWLVGLNYKDDNNDAKAWLKQYANPYSVVAVDALGKAGIDWGVYGVPETFIIDKSGKIRHKIVGALTRPMLAEEVLPLLEKLESEK